VGGSYWFCNTKNTTTYGVGNLVLGLWPVQNVAVLDRLMGFLIIGYPTAIKVCKENKSCTYWHPFKNIHASVSKQKNKKINMGDNKPRKKLSLQWRTLSWFRAKQSLLLLLDDVCLAGNHHIPILQTLVWRDRGCKPRYITRRARYPLLNQYGFIPPYLSSYSFVLILKRVYFWMDGEMMIPR
jgi:hypothetical protein